ncbi:MAG: DoxX family protein [Bacteroidota bacterium]
MFKALLSPQPLFYENGLAVIRIFVGLMMTYHGWEIFDSELMKGYFDWPQMKALPFPPAFSAYAGKGLEFVTGLLLTFGFLTRIGALLMFLNMIFITFFVGEGRFYYQDQHPFLFAIIGAIFFFTGPVKWSVDQKIFK